MAELRFLTGAIAFGESQVDFLDNNLFLLENAGEAVLESISSSLIRIRVPQSEGADVFVDFAGSFSISSFDLADLLQDIRDGNASGSVDTATVTRSGETIASATFSNTQWTQTNSAGTVTFDGALSNSLSLLGAILTEDSADDAFLRSRTLTRIQADDGTSDIFDLDLTGPGEAISVADVIDGATLDPFGGTDDTLDLSGLSESGIAFRVTDNDQGNGLQYEIGDPQNVSPDVILNLADATTVGIGFVGNGLTLAPDTEFETIIGGLGNDRLTIATSSATDYRLEGGGGNDSLLGGIADDTLVGGAGDDVLAGGVGSDVAVFNGARGEYVVAVTGDGTFTVADQVFGRDGTDTLSGIETLEFNGVAVARDAVINLAPVIGLGVLDTSNVDLANLGERGFTIRSEAVYGGAGIAVSAGGDVNGDGFDDVIVGDRFASPPGVPSGGAAFVIFGSANPGDVLLDDVAGGTGGFVINGTSPNESVFGQAIGGGGDVNGDGLDDLIVGFEGADFSGFNTGGAFIVFGKADGTPVNAGSGGFAIKGISSNDNAGGAVAVAGDVNGDGLDDLIVGARNDDPNGSASGATFVVFGKASGATVDLADVEAGNGGFVINGDSANDRSGTSVSSAGDVNGDGLDDLILGVPNDDQNAANAGSAFVVFGKADGTAVELSSVRADASGFAIDGASASDFAGRAVSGAGDVNGDGLADLIVGAQNADPNGGSSGSAYVVFGKADGTTVSLIDVEAGVGGFAINGVSGYDLAGRSVSGAGDLNGDGLDDLIVGAPGNGTNGAAFVVFGKSDGAAVDLSQVANAVGGFVITGPSGYSYAGRSVSNAGDINGDGLDDLIVGAPYDSPSGAAFVVLGRKVVETDFSTLPALSLLSTSIGVIENLQIFDPDLEGTANQGEVTLIFSNGTTNVIDAAGAVIAGDESASVTITGTQDQINAALERVEITPGAGFTGDATLTITVSDLGNTGPGGALTDTEVFNISVFDAAVLFSNNADVINFDDVLVADSADDNNTSDALGGDDRVTLPSSLADAAEAGFNVNAPFLGGLGDDSLTGQGLNDQISGGVGNDTLLGNAGNDTLEGGSGNDVINGGDGNDLLIGGAGDDVLNGGTGNFDLITPGDGNDTVLSAGADTEVITVHEIEAGRGDDTFDFANPGLLFAILDYGNETAAITSDIGATSGTIIKSAGGTDTILNNDQFADFLSGFRIVGTAFNDSHTQNLNSNDEFLEFLGGDGNDSVSGGQTGFLRVNYVSDPGGITANLATGLVIDGFGSTDTVSNVDEIHGNNFNDSILGSAADERFIPLGGIDTIDGAGGIDLVRFDRSGVSSVNVDLAAGTATGTAFGQFFTHTLSNIEEVRGSRDGFDNITGDVNNNLLIGRGGVDSLNGGAGDDTLAVDIETDNTVTTDFFVSSSGNDTFDFDHAGGTFVVLEYTAESSAVQFNVGNTTGTVIKSAGGTDQLINVDQLDGTIAGLQTRGSGFDDTIVVDLIDQNEFVSLVGMGGNDTITGGGGFDRIAYFNSPGAVNVNIATGIALDGFGGTDTFSAIDEVQGSNFSDTLTGGAGDDRFIGRGGDDTIDGAGGRDLVRYDRSGVESVVVDLEAGTAIGTRQGTAFNHTLVSIEKVRGSRTEDSTLRGAGEIENFRGGAGDDVIDGRGNFDEVNFFNATGSVTVSLGSTATATGLGIGTDTISNVDFFFASAFDDTLTADENFDNGIDFLFGDQRLFNRFDGGAGDDTFAGNGATRIQYFNATGGVVVDMATGTATGDASVGNDTFDNGVFEIQGSQFADTLQGSDATPLITGFESFIGGDGADLIDGRGGEDRVFYQFDQAGVNVDLAAGTGIDAFGNTDTLVGIEHIHSGAGDDTLSGDAGDNIFEPDNGADLIDGRGGTDTILYDNRAGGVSVDLAAGTAIDNDGGFDTLTSIENAFGSNFDDTLLGSAGANELRGLFGDDFLGAGPGNDTLFGGEGNDTLSSSGGGSNTLRGGAGDDSGIGANGSDTYVYDSGLDTLQGFSLGAGIDDVIDLSARDDVFDLAGLLAISRDAGSNLVIEFNDGVDELIVRNVNEADLAEDDFLFAVPENLVLNGDGNANTLTGGAGNDTLNGLGGDDDLNGLGGNDQLDGGDGADTLNGGTGDDSASGGGANDNIDGGSGADTLDGGTGDDLLTGSGGADSVLGGADDDQVFGGGDNDTVSGGAGDDVVGGDDGDDSLLGDAGNDTLVGGEGDDTLNGGDGADSLNGNNGNDNIDGVIGSDTLDGGAGDDLLTGNQDADSVLGGAGNDQVFGGAADDTVDGGTGNDIVAGDDGDDVLLGGTGNDTLVGGDGADTLTGGAGNDSATGGAGNDLIVFGAGIDTVAGFSAGAGVGDVLDISSRDEVTDLAGLLAISRDAGANLVIEFIDGVDELIVRNVNKADLNADDFIFAAVANQNLVGDENANTLVGAGGNDTIAGLGGADSLVGDAGDDSIDGGNGADTLDGGLGNDTLLGGLGSDRLIGGAGDDSLDGGDAATDVADFTAATVAINADLLAGTATGQGNDILVNIERLEGGTADDTLLGDDDNNTISGAAGSDSINGRGGDDVFGANLGTGNDTIIGGTGSDRFLLVNHANANATVTISTSGATTTITGGGENFQLTEVEQIDYVGGTGADIVNAANSSVNLFASLGDGNESATGGSGDDTLVGLAGDDVLDGNEGDDVFVFGAGDGTDLVRQGAAGDVDVIQFASGVSLSDIRLVRGSSDLILVNDGTGDAVTVQGSIGTSTNDIEGTIRRVDFADGGQLLFDNGLNLVGTANAESINGSSLGDTLVGLAGDDALDGNEGDDVIFDGAGNDNVAGGTGNDTIFGGTGSNTIAGGSGTDVLVLEGDVFDYKHDCVFSGDVFFRRLNAPLEEFFGSSIEIVIFNGVAIDFADLLATAVMGTSDGETLLGGSTNDFLGALEGDDSVDAGAGNDIVNAAEGDDTVTGGLGDDSLDGGDGADLVDFSTAGAGVAVDLAANSATGGAGTDLLARFENVRGSAFDDTLTGDANDNRFFGGAGNDSVNGAAGTDRIDLTGSVGDFDFSFAADGAMTVSDTVGGEGADTITNVETLAFDDATLTVAIQTVAGDSFFGGSGFDIIAGLGGIDDLRGNGGNDLIDGGAGGDLILGNAGADTLQGGLQRDTIFGGDDNDVVIGGADVDSLRGDGGNDLLDGGDILDFISGNDGDDTLIGGDGNDRMFGGEGADSLQGDTGNDQMFADADADTLFGGAGSDRMDGGTGDDSMDGGDDGDVLFGRAGNDTLLGGGGLDVILGEAGSDSISGGAGNDDLRGGTENDTLSGGAGVDQMQGEAGDDSMSGGDDTDIMQGGEGADVMAGDAGNDRLFGDGGNDTLTGGTGIDRLDGGDGNDSLDGGDDLDDLLGGAGLDTLIGGDGGDRLFGQDGDDQLFGGLGADRLDVGAGNNLAEGAAGNDTLIGRTGNDTLDGGGDNDIMFGIEGADSMSGGAGLDVMLGGIGDDTVDGGAGDDQIFGQDGADSVSGGDGNDRADGGEGDDAVTGGAGNDTVIGRGGADTLTGDAGDDVIFAGAGNDSASGGDDNDRMVGENGDDTLLGGTGNDTIEGRNDNDSLSGEAGADLLLGQSGTDQLDGGAGADILSGGAGDDTLTGGADIDRFQFSSADGAGSNDTITDFVVSTDLFQVFGLTITSVADADADGDTNVDDTLVTFSNGATVGLIGVTGLQESDLF
ncbi:beta strand repeat-containing protein [Minwuia sp.]|uniref:beta strand repeat-containing protein n=1 Tax=Minwuia sp. TaxID=2493630 RepID=UPI003A8E14B9